MLEVLYGAGLRVSECCNVRLSDCDLDRGLLTVLGKGAYTHHIAYAEGGIVEAAVRKCAGVHLYKYADAGCKNGSPRSALIMAKLWWYIVKHKIRIVHTHNFRGHFLGVFAGKLAGAKVIEHVHDFRYWDPGELTRRRGVANLNRYIRLFRGWSDLVVVLTERDRTFLLETWRYPQERVRLIPNGIPVPRELGEGRRRPEHRDPVVLTSARMDRAKNIDLVLAIAPEVIRQVPRARFLIAGDGPSLEAYRQQRDTSPVRDRIELLGPRADVRALLSVADVFLQPSLLELHSIALLEAMSAGVPVVASKGVGCHEEFITSWENGVLLDPFSEAGWSDAVVRLLTDPILQARIARGAYETCLRQFDIEAAAGRIEALYREISTR
jgi:glycosyltransferase involved in cell wall biosynthesis